MSSSSSGEIRELRKLARAWHGEILECKTGEGYCAYFDRYRKQSIYPAPFVTRNPLAIHWGPRVIFGVDLYWPEVIHEMGHVFATNLRPPHSEEKFFLGWEIAVVRHIGADFEEWKAANADYLINSVRIKNMTPAELKKMMRWAAAEARKRGLVRDRIPQCTRAESDE